MNWQDKIKKIEALIAGSKTEGERDAAALARERLLERIQEEKATAAVEYTVPLGNHWRKKLFIAICSKYQVRTYRYKRQKYTTVMIRQSPRFVDQVLVPEFKKYSELLEGLVNEIMEEIIAKIHDVKEEEIVIAGELPCSKEASL